MTSDTLKEGKDRVREHLVEPLQRLGLRAPSGMTVAQFQGMVDELCGRLSYMSALNLQALAEQAAARPGGKDGSRFPLASKLLTWAADIQPPADSASPLMVAVFSGPLGKQAMDEDWAPELLSHLKKNRVWPTSCYLDGIKKRAEEARHKLARLAEMEARGLSGTEMDLDLRRKRGIAAERCAAIMQQIEAQQ